MKLNYTQTFPKDAATVLKMFCDPAYHEKLQKALGAINYRKLEHTDDGKKFRIRMTYEAKSSVPLPGFAKKILGETSEVVQEEWWDRATRTGEVSVTVKNLPGSLRSANKLTEANGTSTKSFNWDVNVKIPLVGGKIEELIANDIRGKIKPEEEAGRKLLAGY